MLDPTEINPLSRQSLSGYRSDPHQSDTMKGTWYCNSDNAMISSDMQTTYGMDALEQQVLC